MFIHYFRTTNDGRVLMGTASGPIGRGGRIDARFFDDAATIARAEQGLRRLLPGLAGARVERAWGGPIDVSSDHLPFFGTVPGTRIHYGVGYSGNGVGPSWLGGQILASLVPRHRRRVVAAPAGADRVRSACRRSRCARPAARWSAERSSRRRRPTRRGGGPTPAARGGRRAPARPRPANRDAVRFV